MSSTSCPKNLVQYTYYVRKYHVALPEKFVSYVKARDGAFPDSGSQVDSDAVVPGRRTG
jgi:hypothetical protein